MKTALLLFIFLALIPSFCKAPELPRKSAPETTQSSKTRSSSIIASIKSFFESFSEALFSKKIHPKEPTITLDDISNNKAASESLVPYFVDNKAELESLVPYLVDYDNFDQTSPIPETGYLLVGPPETEKTRARMAEALAGSVQKILKEKGKVQKLRFISLTPIEFFKSFDSLINLLPNTKEPGPIIIFIREFILHKWHEYYDTYRGELHELMWIIEKLNKDKIRKVVVIMSIDSPQHWDNALRKRGRFGKELYFTDSATEEESEKKGIE